MTARIPAALGVLALLAGLAACAAAAPPARETSGPSSAPREDLPAVTTAPEPVETTTPPTEPTCETLISPATVEALTAQGWTAKEKEFRIGAMPPLEGGMLCLWSDYSTASDHGQMYGWAPIDAVTAAEAQQTLLAEGWLRDDDTSGVYITEDPQYAIAVDDEGYGMTYLFGDGWVTFADTKQGLLLIEGR
ncbi:MULTISPECIES: hypothetical protein [Microbacterium]|uniref:hypothetical protein n=1 Tax=Microbacterium TaxID=33882 RepID=UPI00217E1876|nr:MULTISPECIES: hypothetical protein [Microbacterium]UWF78369.1 hypothetical protein JSY13_05010 [Microbacterium neungamense]WCM56546.1 hypothetical protein JRG78_05015 [Microbacterium sp. EF45047]